jgi:glucose-1-phosphate thymidylyltransferase
LQQDNIRQAISWYKLATVIEIPETSPFVNRVCYTWLPHLQLCLCYSKLGDFYKAQKHNEIASYVHQDGPYGIADGIKKGRDFVGDEKFIVLLGDNIFEDSLTSYIASFRLQEKGAKVLLKSVNDPRRYGIAELDTEKKIITSIVEKPTNPKSKLCVVGIYMYDSSVFHYIDSTVPSFKGELEITDVNNMYIKKGELSYDFLKGWWIDAGTHESLYLANSFYYKDKLVENNE